MNAPESSFPDLAIPAEFQTRFDAQRGAFIKAPEPSRAERLADLKALSNLLKENQSAIVAAIDADYGGRSEFETMFGEMFASLDGLRDAQKAPCALDATAPAERRCAPLSRRPQPPNPAAHRRRRRDRAVELSDLPKLRAAHRRSCRGESDDGQDVGEFSAPGRTPRRDFAEVPPEDKLAFFADGGGRGPAFSSLPFDHLFFTGSGTTGRAVMANAARNLTPVTLELGGKSPAIVAPGYPIETAAERILWAKTFNAGQTCVAVDYAFLPRGSEDEFVSHCRRLFAKRYPDINGPDFTSIIDQQSYDRLTAALEDARAKGARLINLAEGQTPDKSKRRFAPHIVLNVTPEMELMRREIFGPILPILTYREPQEVVDAINGRDRPLALYPFVRSPATRRFLIANTRSGGVSVNDAILHVVQHDLPFGGVGPSGMGHYHGREGFETFSKLRPVFEEGWISAVQTFMQPPYTRFSRRILDLMVWMKS